MVAMTSGEASGAVAGSDVGGTFTDVTVVVGDRLTITKVPSTPPEFDVAASEGMSLAIDQAGVPPDRVDAMLHATTVATNAILEGRGARTALLTTEGFRDVLELRRARSPELYDLFYRPPEPLVERRLRLGIEERIGFDGTILRPLDTSSVEAAIRMMLDEEIEAVAISLLHGYRNGTHEIAAAEIVRRALPRAFVSISSEVLPEIGEYERTSTTVINAYLGPIVAEYLSRMQADLASRGHRASIFVMQSNGALMDIGVARRHPARMVESGPSAGVIGAVTVAAGQGIGDAITFDMGGTTTKAGVIEAGNPLLTSEYEVGGGISSTTGHAAGRGHALRLPVLDIAEVGAGGGSIVRVDEVGRLSVGPQSAGADPGPACYGRGGDEATLTDALVVLGYINGEALAGGLVVLQPDRARRALADRVARPMGIPLEDAADGAFRVALAETARAVKHVTTFRGRRPADFSLIAYGGNGPVIAAALAAELGIARVIVPPAAGVFSSYGLLRAEEAHHFVRPVIAFVDQARDVVGATMSALEAEAAAFIGERRRGASWTIGRFAELRYREQRAAIRVAAGDDRPDDRWFAEVVERFAAEHQRAYGYRAAVEDVEFVNLGLVVARPRGESAAVRLADAGTVAWGSSHRRIHFGRPHGSLETRVVARHDLRAGEAGPLVVDEYDSTIVVPPGWHARVDDHGNVVILAARSVR